MTNEERRFVIDMMTWSYSRISSFENCPWEWLQSRIEDPGNNLDSCYSQFGSLCHELLEGYAKGEIDLFDLPQLYEERFNDAVTEFFPFSKTKDFRQEYYNKGYDYFCNFEGIPEKYEILGVEKKVEFEIEKYSFIGFIDLLLRTKETDEITILDHKSSTIKFKKDGSISKASLPKFEEFQKQLYLYSIPVIEEYGRCDYLEWNLFKDQGSIKIPWKFEDYEAAKKWAVNSIHKIEEETEWPSKPDYMYCRYLCSKRLNCPYKYQPAEKE